MKEPKIYKNRPRTIIKNIIRVIIALILVCAVFLVSMFFYLRKYVVYDDDGAHIVFNQNVSEETNSES